MHQIRFAISYNTVTDTLTIIVWTEDSNGAVENSSSCTITVKDYTGTTVISAWTAGPTENADNTWYATKSGAAALISAGSSYVVSVAMNVGGAFTRVFAFGATT